MALVGAEEQGLLGSQYYAQHPTIAPGRIAANVNVDGANVLGRTTDFGFIGYGKSDLDAVVEVVAGWQGRTSRATSSPIAATSTGPISSTSRSRRAGALPQARDRLLGHRTEWGREQAELYTRENYHQTSDELDEAWDYDGMIEDARLAFYCGVMIAEPDACRDGSRETSSRRRARRRSPRSTARQRAPTKIMAEHHSGGSTWAC